jgi:hypothetical protein
MALVGLAACTGNTGSAGLVPKPSSVDAMPVSIDAMPVSVDAMPVSHSVRTEGLDALPF